MARHMIQFNLKVTSSFVVHLVMMTYSFELLGKLIQTIYNTIYKHRQAFVP